MAQGQESRPPGACPAVIAQIASQLSPSQRQALASLSVGEVTIDGQSARVDPAQLHVADAVQAAIQSTPDATAITLERHGRSWLIDNLG